MLLYKTTGKWAIVQARVKFKFGNKCKKSYCFYQIILKVLDFLSLLNPSF